MTTASGTRSPASTDAPRAALGALGTWGAQGVTPRALIVACLLLPLNAYWIIQMEVVRYQGHPTTVSLFYNSVFILTVLVLGSAAVSRVAPRLALHRNEMLVIYLMVTLASSLAGHDMVQVVAPQVIMPHWLATPENKWENLFFDYLPRHLTIGDPAVYTPAFLGYSTLYTRDRLLAWLPPAGSWATFLIVLSLMMLAMNAILRRRWMDLEKLNYPITHLPLELSEPRLPLLRNYLFWVAFALAGSVDLLNGFHELWPAWPLIKVRVVHYDSYMSGLFQGYPWRALSGTRISFYPFAVGLGMLLPLDLAFSSWFFYIFWKGQRLVSLMLGLERLPGFPYVEEQSAAAYLGLTAFALWMARHYLQDIWLSVRAGRRQPTETDEPMPYAAALWVLGGGAVFLGLFTRAMGMWLWLAIAFFVIYFALSLAVTRIRAELGPPAHDLHRGGPDLFLTNMFGTDRTVFDARQLTDMKLFYWFNRAYRSHPMPIQLEAFKIARMSGISQSHMAGALALATVVGACSAWWAQLHLFYTYGIAAKTSFASTTFGTEPFNELAAWLNAPFGTRWPQLAAYGVGFLFTLLLMFLRVNFIWWPFHPVGYAISSSWSMNCLWLPILIAWVIKTVVLRYFGYKAFEAAIPFALGLVMGEFIIGSLWTLIGIAFQVNTYSFWV